MDAPRIVNLPKILDVWGNLSFVELENCIRKLLKKDNNCCERAVRPFTNLRKSFAASVERRGEVTAAWLTFVETCKLHQKAAFVFFNASSIWLPRAGTIISSLPRMY